MASHNIIGKLGENIAIKYLKSKNYTIIDRNFHVKMGEIDIICKKNEEIAGKSIKNIVFVEVKSKKVDSFLEIKDETFSPETRLTKSKGQKILKTIHHYLSFNKINEKDINIKIIAIIVFLNIKLKKAKIKIYENYIL